MDIYDWLLVTSATNMVDDISAFMCSTSCDKGVVDDEQHWLLFDCDARGGIRQNHASTIERYPSLPELMVVAYDSSPAMAASLSVAIGKALGPSSIPCNCVRLLMESLVDEEGPPKALPSSRFVV
jgi:hypothetical protein